MNPTVVALYSDSEILWMKLEPTSLLLTLLLKGFGQVLRGHLSMMRNSRSKLYKILPSMGAGLGKMTALNLLVGFGNGGALTTRNCNTYCMQHDLLC
jgi:hypothetical protein